MNKLNAHISDMKIKTLIQAHKGMILGVKIILKQLKNYKVLERAFATYPNYYLTLTGEHNLRKTAASIRINAKKKEKQTTAMTHARIRAGHSLGAGLAILLGLLIRPRYPNLRVYAFSTPGNIIYNSID